MLPFDAICWFILGLASGMGFAGIALAYIAATR